MSIPNQICSLEFAKQLKELGVKQDSLFYRFPGNGHQYIFCKYYEQYNPHVDLDMKDGFSAFTVSELSEILFQKNYDHLEEMGYLNIVTEMIDRSGGYFYRITNNLTDHIIDEQKQADALAKLFIILFENRMELPNET